MLLISFTYKKAVFFPWTSSSPFLFKRNFFFSDVVSKGVLNVLELLTDDFSDVDVIGISGNFFSDKNLQLWTGSRGMEISFLWVVHLRRFWEAMNIRRGGELMEVDMLLLDAKVGHKWLGLHQQLHCWEAMPRGSHWQYLSLASLSSQPSLRK